MNIISSTPELAVVVATLVAVLRKHVPGIDGRLVLVVAALTAAALVAAEGGDVRTTVQRAIFVFAAAVGGVSLGDRWADRARSPKEPTA